MSVTLGYFDVELQTVTSESPDGITVQVQDEESGTPICETVFTRAELRELLDRCDALAEAQAPEFAQAETPHA
jgi:hypothetical protein